jgi:hypothetical protein
MAIPVPTPAKTVPRSVDRPAALSFPSAHAEAKTKTHALPTPASPRSASHGAKPSTDPMEKVAMPMTKSPTRMAVETLQGSFTADRAPSR